MLSLQRLVVGCCRCGGVIIHSSMGRARVNGRLEMTRSLGDVDLKRFGVIAEPEIRHMTVGLMSNGIIDACHSCFEISCFESLITFNYLL